MGDRLPSTRQLARELDVDHRVVLAAYRALAEEELVELRPRGGVYLAARPARGGVPPLPWRWFADVLARGLAHEIPGPELPEWLRRCSETLRLRALAVATTRDQGGGIARELADDFGLEVDVLSRAELERASRPPLVLRRADLIVSTEAHREWLAALAHAHRKPLVIVEVRPDLLAREWALLFRVPVFAVVADEAFGEMLRRFFADVAGAENLRVLVLGRDDLSTIPADAPTYVTQRARARLGETPLPGRVLRPGRTISAHSARELFAFIVRSNVEALRGPDD